MSLPRTKKFMSVHSASEVMLTLFWDLIGPILEVCLDCGQSVSSTWYCAALDEELKPTIHSKCREILTNGVVLFHDNA
jgi:hypothetical protein